MQVTPSSQYIGVYFDNISQKWFAKTTIQCSSKIFETELEAAKAYDSIARNDLSKKRFNFCKFVVYFPYSLYSSQT